MFDQIPNVPPIEGAVNVGCGWTANIHMEFTASGHCTVKYLSLNQTTRNRSCRDLEIPPVVIQLGETGLKRPGWCTSGTWLREGGERVV